MPLPTQHSLFCILLFWTTIISIIQAVFIILFFTQGHNSLLQSSRVTEQPPPNPSRIPSSPSLPRQDRLFSDRGKMITFKVYGVDKGVIKWKSTSLEWLINETETTLSVSKGGYYFLNLQVTPLGNGEKLVCKISVNEQTNKAVIMEGSFNTNSSSPLLLSKVAMLSSGEKLEFTTSPHSCIINETESVTHLDIIYLPIQ